MPIDRFTQIDYNAIAEAVAQHAPASAIEPLLALLDATIDQGSGGIISDAIGYREQDQDSADPAGHEARLMVDSYYRVNRHLVGLRHAITLACGGDAENREDK